MRVFVTGAAGFVGSAVVQELLRAGHQVVGLARSEANVQTITAAGAQVHRGDLTDLESLRRGAADSDGVIHTAFIHDFTKFAENCEVDRQAIEAIGSVLAETDRPFIVTSGTGLIAPGRVGTEESLPARNHPFPRVSETIAAAIVAGSVRAMTIRLPPSVHGEGDHGFIPRLVTLAREKGVSAYIGEGLNRWPAVHRLDSAVLYRLILEKGSAGARYHAVADEGVPFREIAGVIGRHLNVPVVSLSPEKAAEHFGWFTPFAGLDAPASSLWTRETLSWKPKHIALIEDIDHDYYFKA